MSVIDALRVVDICCGAVLVGTLSAELGLVLPALRRVAPEAGLPVHKQISHRGWRSLPFFGVAFGVLAGVIAVLEFDWDEPSTRWLIAGLVLLPIAVGCNVGLYLRADRAFTRHGSAPDDYLERLATLFRLNLLRLSLFAGSFVCVVTAAVLS